MNETLLTRKDTRDNFVQANPVLQAGEIALIREFENGPFANYRIGNGEAKFTELEDAKNAADSPVIDYNQIDKAKTPGTYQVVQGTNGGLDLQGTLYVVGLTTLMPDGSGISVANTWMQILLSAQKVGTVAKTHNTWEVKKRITTTSHPSGWTSWEILSFSKEDILSMTATRSQGAKADTALQAATIGGAAVTKSGTTLQLPAYPTTLPASDRTSILSAAETDATTKVTNHAALTTHLTAAERTAWNAKPDATQVKSTADESAAAAILANVTNKKGAAGGLASLDSAGRVPATQLPSYVDDVLEATWVSTAPTTGIVPGAYYYNTATKKIHTGLTATTLSAGTVPESGKIYVRTENNVCYRWSGTDLIEISKSLVIGTTPGTAYDGGVGTALGIKLARIPKVLTGVAGEVAGSTSTTLSLAFAATNLDGSPSAHATLTVPSATPAKAGVMTAADKTKLDTLTAFDGWIDPTKENLDNLKTPGVYKICNSNKDLVGELFVINGVLMNGNTPTPTSGGIVQSKRTLEKNAPRPNSSIWVRRTYYPSPVGTTPAGWTPWIDEYQDLINRAVQSANTYTDSAFRQALDLSL